MSKSMPVFGGVIKKVAQYKDTNTVKVIVQLRQIGLNGADITEMQDLEEWQHVCFRLPGLTYLENLGKELTADWRANNTIKQNEEVAFVPGRYIYFNGVGPSKWDGKSEYDGHQLLKMIVVVPESISASEDRQAQSYRRAGCSCRGSGRKGYG